MGRRGPKPMPTALKLQLGVGLHNKMNREEPDIPVPARLKPPKGLKLRARVEWRRLADMLVERGVLKESDLHAFAQYCTMVAEIEEFETLINATTVEEAVAGGYVRALHSLRAQCGRQEARLGLDPSSRSGIKAVGVPKRDEAQTKRARFFGKGA